jgi:hypothetical protein
LLAGVSIAIEYYTRGLKENKEDYLAWKYRGDACFMVFKSILILKRNDTDGIL